MGVGNGRIDLGLVADADAIGGRVEALARLSDVWSVAGYGRGVYNWRARSVDWSAGLILGAKW